MIEIIISESQLYYWRMTQPYELPASAICEKSGMMYLHQEEKKNLKKFFCVFVFVRELRNRRSKGINLHTRVHREMEQLRGVLTFLFEIVCVVNCRVVLFVY